MHAFFLSAFLFLLTAFSMLFGCHAEIFSEDNQLKSPSESLPEYYNSPSKNETRGEIIPFCDTECQSKEQFFEPNQFDVLNHIKEANINGRVFQIEVADTENKRSKGLMNRESISDYNAMLFVFENEKRRSFWMKNTLVPLDLIFLSSSGEVLEIYNMVTQIGHQDAQLKIYRSTEPVKLAMEVRGGLVEEIPIWVGSYILFR